MLISSYGGLAIRADLSLILTANSYSEPISKSMYSRSISLQTGTCPQPSWPVGLQVNWRWLLAGCLSLSAGWLLAATAPAVAQSLEAAEPAVTAVPLAAAEPVAIPPLPPTVPAAIAPSTAGLVGLYPSADTELGVGHLRPKDLSSLQGRSWPNSSIMDANWLQGVALPLYANPEAEPWGWLINGWLITDQSQPLAVGRDAAFSMLHTYYGLYTFPVMEIRADGWFRFQYTPAGTAWAHVSHLNVGSVELTLETWEERFLEAGMIEFRRHGSSQSLLPQPSSDAAVQALISPNSLIEPLEFEGDWARVRVLQPAEACAPLPGATAAEGWIRWRNHQDSLVWFPAQGC